MRYGPLCELPADLRRWMGLVTAMDFFRRRAAIVSAMVSKTFRYEIVQLMVAVLKGVFYRINGQHTAQARLELADMPTAFSR